MLWMIRSTTREQPPKKRGKWKRAPSYWSRDVGWTWREQADVFSDEEKEALQTMPAGGVWEKEPI